MGLLASSFNPATVPALMCRTTVSVGWDGALWDCDFNQALGVPLQQCGAAAPPTLWSLDSFTIGADAAAAFGEGAPIATTKACYGCTAGSGSSCGGALAKAAPRLM